MCARLPDGETAPADGVLPAAALGLLAGSPFGIYVHVPFCATRCGYCDFNTYTASELPGGGSRAGYAAQAIAEIAFARDVLGDDAPPVDTVFFGGGTPTLLEPGDLAGVLRAIEERFGLAAGAEVTTEANPESVDPASLHALRAAGFTRVSIGMQSAVGHVLETLDRVHTPGRATAAAREAREAGFEHVSLDLIYGTPGETDDDWRNSVEAALAAEPDHVSLYGLIVEPGTRMAVQVRRGELPAPDEDAMADRYLLADELLAGAGFECYELCSWATGEGARCRHNVGYWSDGNWWGVGPGAHSHVGGTRWWNVLHPTAYAERLGQGVSPAAAREEPDAEARRLERVMLGLRLSEGIELRELSAPGQAAAAAQAAAGTLDAAALAQGRVVLTRAGRLVADAVIRELTDLAGANRGPVCPRLEYLRSKGHRYRL